MFAFIQSKTTPRQVQGSAAKVQNNEEKAGNNKKKSNNKKKPQTDYRVSERASE